MIAKQRNLVLVAGHFPPGNLVNVHRARLWSQYLPDLGWNPIVVTTHHDYYEERLDWDLHALVDSALEVVRTPALPTRPIRLVGDIGIRGLLPHYYALCKLAEARRMDFLHITIPSNFSAVLGRMVCMRYGIPYGIDYNDPWVHPFPGSDIRFTKAWASARLAERLEPWAVRDVSLITGVASAYYEGVLQRHPELRARAVTAAMPFGVSELDYDALAQRANPPYLFDPNDGNIHILYAGTIWSKAFPLLDRLMEGLALLRRAKPALAARLRLHFVGSGKRADDPQGHNVLPYIDRHGLHDMVEERPTRIPYLDVLQHLQLASGNLIMGSTERHYTPSKAFQVMRARRPVFALLHRESTAIRMLADAQAGFTVSFGDHDLPGAEIIAEQFEKYLLDIPRFTPLSDYSRFTEHTARHSTELLADAVTRALRGPAPVRR